MKTADYWEQARRADEYVANMQQKREPFLENMARTEITPEDRLRFGAQPLRVLTFTEEWCNDSVQFLAALIKLAHEVPSVEVRILERDRYREVADRYPRKDGYHAIPIFVLFDAEMRELGALVERPARATQEIAEETRRFQQAHPELPGINRMVDRMPDETRALVKANTATWRVDKLESWVRYFFEDLAAIVQGARAEQAA